MKDSAHVATSIEKVDQNLSSVFDVLPIPRDQLIDKTGEVVMVDGDAPDAEKLSTDTDFARNNIYSLVNQGQDALQYALDLAKQSDSPRAFEVVATLLKSLSDINMQLLETHERKAKVTPKKQDSAPDKVVNNNSIVFNGTTAQLNEMLKGMKRE